MSDVEATHRQENEDPFRRANSADEYECIRMTGSSGAGGFSRTIYICEYTGAVLTAVPTPAMQHALARPAYANPNRRLVAVKNPVTRREVAALRTLSHGGIIQFYDAFVDHVTDTLHLIMEPMEGNAYQLMKSRKGRPFAPELLVDMARQLARALAYMHDTGWVHRDLRPESILVTTLGLADWLGKEGAKKDVVAQVKLCSFGRACRIGTATDDMGVDIIWYDAPEGQASTAGVDMWVLGVVLAEMTMLRPVFSGRHNGPAEDYWASVRDIVVPDVAQTAQNLAFASADWAECVALLFAWSPRDGSRPLRC